MGPTLHPQLFCFEKFPSKIFCVHFCLNKMSFFSAETPILVFGQLDIAVKPHLRYLGIEIDEHLSFKYHVNNFKTKLPFCDYVALRTRSPTISQLFTYYRTHVKPIVQYSASVCGYTSYLI